MENVWFVLRRLNIALKLKQQQQKYEEKEESLH